MRVSLSFSISLRLGKISVSVTTPVTTDFFRPKALSNKILQCANYAIEGIITGTSLASPVVQCDVELIKLSTYIAANREFISEIR